MFSESEFEGEQLDEDHLAEQPAYRRALYASQSQHDRVNRRMLSQIEREIVEQWEVSNAVSGFFRDAANKRILTEAHKGLSEGARIL